MLCLLIKWPIQIFTECRRKFIFTISYEKLYKTSSHRRHLPRTEDLSFPLIMILCLLIAGSKRRQVHFTQGFAAQHRKAFYFQEASNHIETLASPALALSLHCQHDAQLLCGAFLTICYEIHAERIYQVC